MDGASQSTPDRPLTGLIALRAASPDLVRRLADGTGGRPADWHPEYPTTETVTAAAMTLEALAASSDPAAHPTADPTDGTGDGDGGVAGGGVHHRQELDDAAARWGLFQVVADGLVVGDAGFHGPPPEESPRVVEIGYSVVADRRGSGIATAACRLLLDLAWAGGVDQVRAETEWENAASRRVLQRNGFRLVDAGQAARAEPLRFVIDTPGRGRR